MFVEGEPTQPFLAGEALGKLYRNVRLNEIACFLQIGIRIDQYRLPAIRGIENIEIASGICFQQQTDPVAFAKLVRRIDAYCQAVGVSREECQPESNSLSRRFR